MFHNTKNFQIYGIVRYQQYLNFLFQHSASKSGGFTYHEKTPTISGTLINPAGDSQILMELSRIASAKTCPIFSVGQSPIIASSPVPIPCFSMLYVRKQATLKSWKARNIGLVHRSSQPSMLLRIYHCKAGRIWGLG